MNELDQFLDKNELGSGDKSLVEFEEIILDELLDVKEKFVEGKDGNEGFAKIVATYRGEVVYLPKMVLIFIKEQKKKFTFTKINVSKTGTGKNDTKYSVVLLDPIPKQQNV